MAPQFMEDMAYWSGANPRVGSRAWKLVRESLRSPFAGTGKPEPLTGGLAGLWSRRITDEHRLLYRVTDARIEFIQARFHY